MLFAVCSAQYPKKRGGNRKGKEKKGRVKVKVDVKVKVKSKSQSLARDSGKQATTKTREETKDKRQRL